MAREAKRVGVHQTDFVNAKVNQELLPLLSIYNGDDTQVLLQISDLHAFFGAERVSAEDLQALLYKTKIVDDWSSEISERADNLPLIKDNIDIDILEEEKQNEIDVYQSKDQGLGTFGDQPLVDQFKEIFDMIDGDYNCNN